MGNICTSLSPLPARKRPAKRLTNPPQPARNSSHRCSRSRSSMRKDKLHESVLQDQAIAAAILLRQRQLNGGSLQFDRAASLRCLDNGQLGRSSDSRTGSLTDPLIRPHLLGNQDLKLDKLESMHFVLVHGGGFGAWCWYKTIALLEAISYEVTAVDLTGSGIHPFDTNAVTSLSHYVIPLTDFLDKLEDGEKVILVGHDLGGACISYAMELFPRKVAKAVFIAAVMLANGQSTPDMISQQAGSNGLMQQAQIFRYANGNDQPPTAIDLDKSLFKQLLFNQSPTKDIALASVSMRSIPFAPVLEKLSLSETNYGSIRRFYIETTEDNALPLTVQESMTNSRPPEKVFQLKGSDHCPFFSRPQALHKLLVEISSTQQA